jgi:peptidoglycan hydrolase FlgJ
MSATLSNASVFTELNGLNSIRQLGKENTSQAMRQVAEQFESIFLNMMLKGMRAGEDALFKDNFMNSNEMQFHRENLDNQLSLHMASTGGVGLSDALHRQLMARYPDEAARAGTGGTGQMNGVINPQRRISGQAVGQSQPLALNSPRALSPQALHPPQALHSPQALHPPQAQGSPSAPAPQFVFETQQDFVDALMPLAEKAAAKLGVEPRELIAQAALETGWGKKMITGEQGKPSHNLFGIKAGTSWQGDSASVNTLEYRDGAMQRERSQFRAYDSFEDSFDDYVQLLSTQPRYQLALADTASSTGLGHRLQQAGYATDP